MPDWTRSMQQTFEFYRVDPGTWSDAEKIDTVISGNGVRDLDSETLGSATFTITEDIGEVYVRPYLITVQDSVRERTPLGTYLCQTPGRSFDGMITNIDVDAYTPLIELKEKNPPLGYSIPSGQNILSIASRLVKENVRCPVVMTENAKTLYSNFVADVDESWLEYLKALLLEANYEPILDEYSRILFAPVQSLNALRPKWTFDDSNSSILYPEIQLERDLYGVPNVVEIVYSKNDHYLYSKAVNDDPNSPVSTVARGREIMKRITDPDLAGTPDQAVIDQYARTQLRELSSLEYTITYTHGYCPVTVGDCVRLNYERAGLENIKAKIIRQSINFEPGCPVEETAIFSSNLWG